MSQVEAPRGRTCSRRLRPVALLASGVLVLPVLAGCSSGEEQSRGNPPAQDISPADRELVADGGTLRWAVDTMPATLNSFQADADATTGRIAGAVLPALFTLDAEGRPQRNPDYLESAEIVEREPKQVVLYKLNQQAVWSDGREIGAPDFLAQWRALSGKDSSYWTARNAGYDRIQKVERGANDLEVKVTFTKPYADWQSLFTPLYPKDVTGTPAAFNDGARTKLKVTAGPFRISKIDQEADTTTLVRNPRWWGDRPKLDELVLSAVPREKRVAALAAGSLDLAAVDPSAAERIAYAVKDAGRGGRPLAYGPGAARTPSAALKSWAMAHGSDEELAEVAQQARKRAAEAEKKYAQEQSALSKYEVRKSLEPAYTQLALNGESGPLADDRVRRAIARALNRKELAETVLTPLGLPAEPPGNHLALAGQAAYTDNSAALGEQDTQEAQALLADAGWTPEGLREAPAKAGGEAGKPEENGKDGKEEDKKKTTGKASAEPSSRASAAASQKNKDAASDDGLYIVGDDKPAARDPRSGSRVTHVLAPAPGAALQSVAVRRQAASLTDDGAGPADRAAGKAEDKGGMAGAYAPRGTAAPGAAAGGALGKDGKPLSLRFVLPSGAGSEVLRTVGDKIAQMLDRVGVRTEIIKVDDASFFKDHIASGDYDLALYSWPSSPFPATDARPIYAKPKPASDGSLLVEQNYTRVGTDYIDQLFTQAAGELDADAARDLMRRADARIWAAAGSVPLYQRPELVAARKQVVNAGAFGFGEPRYQDIGFKTAATAPKQ
ncbi:ABC transporter family substrate-binding protein [Streptomyces pristinaespiralis]|uniref:Lipoprotein n=1 Tax=Streptomyces pristinaespiralis TaxID=38300 RepID=A0A0M4DR53_STRPR|nr:ABC transporter family substrate-binding protein [Streptomyces pristinaespiralis]ALC21075.1 lipoprotein [Streptomyces pristinaespiralis]QMU16159.1 ABC transporter family substrate-binding protein [Streptomyces pristinaespiralis]